MSAVDQGMRIIDCTAVDGMTKPEGQRPKETRIRVSFRLLRPLAFVPRHFPPGTWQQATPSAARDGLTYGIPSAVPRRIRRVATMTRAAGTGFWRGNRNLPKNVRPDNESAIICGTVPRPSRCRACGFGVDETTRKKAIQGPPATPDTDVSLLVPKGAIPTTGVRQNIGTTTNGHLPYLASGLSPFGKISPGRYGVRERHRAVRRRRSCAEASGCGGSTR